MVAAAAVVLALTACGQRTDAGGAGSGSESPSTVVPTTGAGTASASSAVPPSQPPASPSPPVTVGPSGTVLPPGVTQVPKDQVDAGALPEWYQIRDVWMFDGGRSLQMYAMANNGCAGVEAKIVDQSDAAVRIVLSSMLVPQGGSPDGQMCTQALEAKPVVVHLEAPLGDRTVVLAEGR